MTLILILLTAAALIIAIMGLTAFFAWYHADDQKVFAPYAKGRVTFKTVVQRQLGDIRDVLKLDVAVRWITTNIVALAVLLNGMMALADPTLRNAILTANFHGIPIGAIGLLLLAWLASLKRSAPPAKSAEPEQGGRGPGAEAEASAGV